MNKNKDNNLIKMKNTQPYRCNYNLHLLTIWYNIGLYFIILYTFLFNNFKIIRSYLIFTIPITIIGEYTNWRYKLYKRCNIPIKKAIVNSIIYHLIPLSIFLFSNNYKYKEKFDYTGFYLGLLGGAFYLIIYNFKIKKIYGIQNLTKTIIICLIFIYLTMYFIVRK